MDYLKVKKRNERLRHYLRQRFGFVREKINILESDDDATRHCVFEVCDIVYRLENGTFSIVSQPKFRFRDESR